MAIGLKYKIQYLLQIFNLLAGKVTWVVGLKCKIFKKDYRWLIIEKTFEFEMKNLKINNVNLFRHFYLLIILKKINYIICKMNIIHKEKCQYRLLYIKT